MQGVSIGKYILDKKLEESKRMIAEQKYSIAEIAESLGFDDPSYYCRIFKKNYGLTPSAYKNKCAEKK